MTQDAEPSIPAEGTRGLLREAALSAVLAGLIAVVVTQVAPAGPDVPAHLFQRSFFLQHGFSLWNNLWYAGKYDSVTYSLIYYPLAALFGLEALAVLSVMMATFAFTLLVRGPWGRPARWSSLSFAVVWPGVVLTGALPFALGMALALLGLAGLQRRAHRSFGVLTLLCLAASPLAFLFLALPLCGVLVTHWSEWHRFRRPLRIMALAVAGELVLWRLFPSGGRYPFWSRDFLGACTFAALGAVCSWRVERLRALRWLFVLYGAAAVAVFVIPSQIGSNIARVRLAALPIGLLLVTVRRWQPLPLCVAVMALGGWWNATALTAAYARSNTDTSSQPSYWQPAIDWLGTHLSSNYRVEAVDTSGHWPALYLPGAGIPLARGWFRQADFPGNDLLYHPLSPTDYVGWLHSLGVEYVVLSDAPPDFSARSEAGLLRGGRSGLALLFRDGAVSIYGVPDPEPIVTGPGAPVVTELTPTGLVVDLDQPGTFRIAVRWSPYWQASQGCLAAAPDGMMTLSTPSTGPVDLTIRVNPLSALRVLTGISAAACPPG